MTKTQTGTASRWLIRLIGFKLAVITAFIGAVIAVLLTAVASLGAFIAQTQTVLGFDTTTFAAYTQAAERCDGLEWPVIAGIGQVETRHGTYRGAFVNNDGDVTPPIIGIALNGTNNTRAIPDTDNGMWDQDVVWDRAVGPMQFIPTSWRLFGVDGNNDGLVDPHNMFDAAAAAADHLCTSVGGIISSETDLRRALLGYNNSITYVQDVLGWAAQYEAAMWGATTPIICPVPGSTFSDTWLAPRGGGTRQHQGVDMFADTGSVALAPENGRVEFYYNTVGGNSYRLFGASGTYFYGTHLQASIGVDREVTAGEVIGLVGTTGNAAGTPPHLHFQIHPAGRGTPAINPTPTVTAACAMWNNTSDAELNAGPP